MVYILVVLAKIFIARFFVVVENAVGLMSNKLLMPLIVHSVRDSMNYYTYCWFLFQGLFDI